MLRETSPKTREKGVWTLSNTTNLENLYNPTKTEEFNMPQQTTAQFNNDVPEITNDEVNIDTTPTDIDQITEDGTDTEPADATSADDEVNEPLEYTSNQDLDGAALRFVAGAHFEYHRDRHLSAPSVDSDAFSDAEMTRTLFALREALCTIGCRPAKAAEIHRILRDAADKAIEVTAFGYAEPKPPTKLSSTIHEDVPETKIGRLVYYPGTKAEKGMDDVFAPTAAQLVAVLNSALTTFENDVFAGTTSGIKTLRDAADKHNKAAAAKYMFGSITDLLSPRGDIAGMAKYFGHDMNTHYGMDFGSSI